MATLNPIQKIAVNIDADVLVNSGAKLAHNEPLRRWVVSRVEKKMVSELKRTRTDPNYLPGIADDRTVMGLAILGIEILEPSLIIGVVTLCLSLVGLLAGSFLALVSALEELAHVIVE